MRVVLASSSPRRQELLTQLGLRYEVIKPEIDESRLAGEDLVDYAERLSREKVEAVVGTLGGSPSLVIAADTIVIDHEGELLGKPYDAADARLMLQRLRNRAHQVITAFTLLCNADPACYGLASGAHGRPHACLQRRRNRCLYRQWRSL